VALARVRAGGNAGLDVGSKGADDSKTRSTVSRKISRNPMAVLADASTNKVLLRDAYSAASLVGTCRVSSYHSAAHILSMYLILRKERKYLICLVPDNDYHRRLGNVSATLCEPPLQRFEGLAIRYIVN
jgi:hypothetical protein